MHSKTVCSLVAAVLAALPMSAWPGVLTPELEREIALRSASERIPVIIQFADRVDARQYEVRNRQLRDNRLLVALRAKSDRARNTFDSLLANNGGREAKPLWLINGIAVTLSVAAIRVLERIPAIGRIQYDAVVPLEGSVSSAPVASGWNLSALHVPEVWQLGASGVNIVVANMDTGVDPNHPDLAGKWRGGVYDWFDPSGQHAEPHDADGHGTQTMGLMVGGAASGTSIGVAPDAHWIAAKIFDDSGQSTLSKIHLAFQWLLDPDGNAATLDAPDVVNASWALNGGAPGTCNLEFNEDITMLKAAGLAVVFAAGNNGPSAASSTSPANNPAGYSVGAVDSGLDIADQSSRGPSGCDGSIFPKLVAPGVNVVTSDLSFGGMPIYATVSGTSFAAPHVAGAMALLAGAFPTASVADLESALTTTAQDLGDPDADTNYGYGLANVLAAHGVLAGTSSEEPPDITSVPTTTALENTPYVYQVSAVDPNGGNLVFSLDSAPGGMAIDAASGQIDWIPSHAQAGANPVSVRVSDPTGLFDMQSFTVDVAMANTPPSATNDSYYAVAHPATSGLPQVVAAPGVLGNDTDQDGDALHVAAATIGRVTLNTDGSFTLAPAGYGNGTTGTVSFTYQALDSSNSASSAATVYITVALNRAPEASEDVVAVPRCTVRQGTTGTTCKTTGTGAYVPNLLSLVDNDTDLDTQTMDATNQTPFAVARVRAPTSGSTGGSTLSIKTSAGGKVTVSGGKASYVPAYNFTGTDVFQYRVKDKLGKESGSTTTNTNNLGQGWVTVTVNVP